MEKLLSGLTLFHTLKKYDMDGLITPIKPIYIISQACQHCRLVLIYKIYKMYRVFVSLFLGMLLLAGCGKDSTVSPPEVSLSLSAIEVTTASDVEVTAKLNKIAEKPVTVRLEFS